MSDDRPRIDLWLMPCHDIDQARHAAVLARLPDGERAEHDRHAKPADRLLYAAAHSLKRHALSARFGGPPDGWTFVDGPHGKPRLSNPPDGRDPRFNLSHTPGLVAVAVADGIELGLDIEALDPAHVDLDTAMAFAHASELGDLDPAAPDFVDRFYRLWTRKEALAKATGLGLSLDVRELIVADELDGQWHLHEQEEDTGHRLALIAELKLGEPAIVTHRISAAAMIAGAG